MQLLGTLDSNNTLSHVDLSGNRIDERLLLELDSINSSRNIRGIPSTPSGKPPLHEESGSGSAKRSASSSRKSGSRSASDTSESAKSKSKHSVTSELGMLGKIV